MVKEAVKSARVQRKPLHQRGPQAINGGKDPEFEYRFVNDTGSRIANFKEAGYELVQDDELIVGDARVKDSSDLGTAKKVISDDGTVSYLMKIKQEWYKEDQKAKETNIAETVAAMKKEASQGMYGSLKVSRD